MSRAAEVRLLFGGEDRLFALKLGRWRAVQEVCDAGPMELLRRFVEGTWRLDDLREPIRQGLVGGGMAVTEVDALLRREFDDLPLGQFVLVAQAIVQASVVGAAEEDGVGEPAAGARRRPRSRAEKSASRRSTKSVAPSA